MDAVGVRTYNHFIENALSIVAALNLTASAWPQDADVPDEICCDFVIVGLGTAGSILANRLTEDERYKVCAIEAGGDPPIESMYAGLSSYLINTKSDWNFTTRNDCCTARQHRENILDLTSGKVLGGDSSIGHSIYVRGDPHDYVLWAEAAKDQSWNYEHLLPYFKKTERLQDDKVLNSSYKEFHGTKGNMIVTRQPHKINNKYLEAFSEMYKVVLDTNGNDTLGFAQPMFMIGNGVRQSMAITFLSPITNRKNLVVLKNTLATKIIFDGKNAIGVKARRKNGTVITVKAKREVLVCAGTIKSPQLLMLSGIGPADHLKTMDIKVRADLPVGKNYQDHLGVIFAHKLDIKNSYVQIYPEDAPLPTVIGYVSVNKTQTNPVYQAMNFIISSDSKSLLSQCSVSYTFKKNICQSMYDLTKGYETMFTKHGVLHPKSRGEVLLKTTDPYDDPIIKTGFYSNPQDLEDEVDYMIHFLQVEKTKIFKKYKAEFVYLDLPPCDHFKRGSREYWKCYAFNMMSTTYHYCSTCSIGLVVDNRLRVYGIGNLRVVDASAIPYITSGNIQAPVMAVAEKGADMVKEDNPPEDDANCS